MSTLTTRVAGDLTVIRGSGNWRTVCVMARNATYVGESTTYGGLLFAATGCWPDEMFAPIDPTFAELRCEHPGLFAHHATSDRAFCGKCCQYIPIADL